MNQREGNTGDAKRTKSCPKCGGVMNFRLGDFECAECGHTEPAQRASERGMAEQTPSPPLTPPAENMRRQPSVLHEMPGEPPSRRSPPVGLTIEKILILAVMIYIPVPLLLEGFRYMHIPRLSPDEVLPGFVVGFVVPALPFCLAALAVAVAFFGRSLWFKWSCFGCSSLLALILVVFLPGVVKAIHFRVTHPSHSPSGQFGMVIAILVFLVLALWIASVVYRDIRWRKRQDSDRA